MTLIHTVNIKLPSTHLATTEPIHIFRAMHLHFLNTVDFVGLREFRRPNIKNKWQRKLPSVLADDDASGVVNHYVLLPALWMC